MWCKDIPEENTEELLQFHKDTELLFKTFGKFMEDHKWYIGNLDKCYDRSKRNIKFFMDFMKKTTDDVQYYNTNVIDYKVRRLDISRDFIKTWNVGKPKEIGFANFDDGIEMIIKLTSELVDKYSVFFLTIDRYGNSAKWLKFLLNDFPAKGKQFLSDMKEDSGTVFSDTNSYISGFSMVSRAAVVEHQKDE